LLEFIPKPKRFRPIKARFWEREFGAEFNRWEFTLLKDFNQAKLAKYPVISGTVITDSKLGKERFLLIPAPYLNQDFVFCVCPPSISLPSDWSYVTISGKKRWLRDHYEIWVDDISPIKLETPSKPEIEFKDFQESLLLQWSGIESPLRELLAFEFISSPALPMLQQTGGLNLSMYDGTGIGLSKKLLRYFRRVIPPEMVRGKSGLVRVPWMSAAIRLRSFSWSFKVADGDKPLNQSFVHFLSNRNSRRFSEISVGLGSDKGAPTFLYEPLISMVDQPTLLPPSAEKRRINIDPPLEVTKYIVTTHLFYPTIGETQDDFMKVLDEASSKIIQLAKKKDVPHLVRRHSLFDPNYYGKPQSMLRIALAFARVHGKNAIDTSWTMKAVDDFYVKNMELITEAWPDYFTSKGVETASLKSELDKQVLRFVTDNETKDTGVGFHLIEEHFINRNSFDLRNSLMHLEEKGKIYEKKRDVFRSIPE
jgi:hypothetical protein